MSISRKARLFFPLTAILFLADCSTKALAVERLSPDAAPRTVLGDWLRFTLTYNRGAALGISLGTVSRVGFAALAVVALLILIQLYRQTAPTATLQIAALSLIMAGALGNLLDRLRSPHGVVDFIDMGVGSLRFYTFNLADAFITVGAVLLAILLWRSRPGPEAGA